MHCSAVKQQMKLFLDDMLGEQADQEIKQHIVRCSECSWYAESTGSLSHTLREMALIEIPRELIDFIPGTRKGASDWRNLSVAVSVLFFIAGLLFFLASGGPREKTPAPYVTAEIVTEGSESDDVIINKLKSILRALNANAGKEDSHGN